MVKVIAGAIREPIDAVASVKDGVVENVAVRPGAEAVEVDGEHPRTKAFIDSGALIVVGRAAAARRPPPEKREP